MYSLVVYLGLFALLSGLALVVVWLIMNPDDQEQTDIPETPGTYQWYPDGEWSGCSATACQTQGTRTRPVKCSTDPDAEPGPTERCDVQKRADVATQPCLQDCLWSLVNSTDCSGGSCGQAGTKRSTYECRFRDGQPAPVGMCGNSNPSGPVSCTMPACQHTGTTYSWQPSGTWSVCSASCGTGTQTQGYVCKDSRGTPAPGQCTGTAPADMVRDCPNLPACQVPVTYSWDRVVGVSPDCSKLCDGGTRKIEYACFETRNGQKTQLSSNFQCHRNEISNSGPTTESCNTQACPTWVIGEWGPRCTKDQDPCTQQRSVTCPGFAETYCLEKQRKPATSRTKERGSD